MKSEYIVRQTATGLQMLEAPKGVDLEDLEVVYNSNCGLTGPDGRLIDGVKIVGGCQNAAEDRRQCLANMAYRLNGIDGEVDPLVYCRGCRVNLEYIEEAFASNGKNFGKSKYEVRLMPLCGLLKARLVLRPGLQEKRILCAGGKVKGSQSGYAVEDNQGNVRRVVYLD